MGYYHLFGWLVKSELALPGLEEVTADRVPDVVIERGDLTANWQRAGSKDWFAVESPSSVLFSIEDAGIYRVEDGNHITVSAFPDADSNALHLYLLGSCLGALLLERRIYPLHGSAVVIDGRAYVIVGESGAGKSTLAMAFAQLGYSLLTDDIAAVSLAHEAQPMIIPSYPQQKVWQETLDAFGDSSAGLRPLYLRDTKYYRPMRACFASHATPLAGVIELVKTKNPQPSLIAIPKMKGLELLFQHTYRNMFIPQMKLMAWHFQESVQLARQITIHRLERPARGAFTAAQLAFLILHDVAGKQEMISQSFGE
ncbi:MAG: aldolase [Sporolactobacillus sp.]